MSSRLLKTLNRRHRRQTRRVLEHIGHMDRENIELNIQVQSGRDISWMPIGDVDDMLKFWDESLAEPEKRAPSHLATK